MQLPPSAACKRLLPGGGRRARAGFTLIELMMVIGIIAISFGVGIPAFVQSRKKAPLQQAVTDVLDACEKAREQSILSGAPAALVFTVDDNVQMHVESSGGRGGSFSATIPNLVTVRMLDVNFQSKLKEEQARIRFLPGGTSDEFTIVLQGAAGGTYKISLDVMTAVADLEELK